MSNLANLDIFPYPYMFADFYTFGKIYRLVL